MQRKLLYILFLLFTLNGVFAQNISKKYIMKTTEHGTLFFILPSQIPLSSSNNCNKNLTLDFTYLTKKDSITINSTFIAQTQERIDSILIHYNKEKQYHASFMIFYTQQKSNKWHYRISIPIPYSILRQAYMSEEPFTIEIISKKNSSKFSFPKQKWDKARSPMNQIFTVIEAN